MSGDSWSTQIKMERLLMHKGPLVHINHSHRTAAFSRKPFYTATYPEQQQQQQTRLQPLQQDQENLLLPWREQADKELEKSIKSTFAKLIKLVDREAKRITAGDALMLMSQESGYSPFVLSNPDDYLNKLFQRGVKAYINEGKEQADRNLKILYRYAKPGSAFPGQHDWDAAPFSQMRATEYEKNVHEIADALKRKFRADIVEAATIRTAAKSVKALAGVRV